MVRCSVSYCLAPMLWESHLTKWRNMRHNVYPPAHILSFHHNSFCSSSSVCLRSQRLLYLASCIARATCIVFLEQGTCTPPGRGYPLPVPPSHTARKETLCLGSLY